MRSYLSWTNSYIFSYDYIKKERNDWTSEEKKIFVAQWELTYFTDVENYTDV